MNNKDVVISNAMLNTIEKDLSNGKFESMTESIIGLNGGLQSIVNIFKTIFPKLDSVSAKDALTKTEDSFQNGYIRDSLYLVDKDNLVNRWYLDPDLNKWIVVEKQRFIDLKKVKSNRVENRLLNLTVSSLEVINDKLKSTGIKAFIKGGDFSNVEKWNSLKNTELLEKLSKFHENAKSWTSTTMKSFINAIESGVVKTKGGTRNDLANKGESAYINIAKIIKSLKSVDGTTEATAEFAPQAIENLKIALLDLKPICNSVNFKTALKKVVK